MIDLKTLYERVADVMARRKPAGASCIGLEIWRDPGGRGPRVKVSIWDGTEHHRGPTPEAAFAVFSAAVDCDPLPLADLAEVALPEPVSEAS